MKVVAGDVESIVLNFLDHRRWLAGGEWGPRAATLGRRVGARPTSFGVVFWLSCLYILL